MIDEYMLNDLQSLCEYQVIQRLEPENVVKILTDSNILLPVTSEDKIKEAAKEVLISEFPIVLEENSDVEQELSKVKGLWSSLLMKAINSGDSKAMWITKRRLSLFDEKRVRFKISNHIYAPSSEGENDEEEFEEEDI